MRSAKFGASIRKLFSAAVKSQNTKYECPHCHKIKINRVSTSVWKCKSCDAMFAGGAYSFTTEAGEISARLVSEYARS
ncbi:transposase [Candidatus Micrarchaeota archaeon]|nr:transposase [Candidatus Micrarchaeota archaeon]